MKKKSWFERNEKKTLFFTVLIMFLLFVFIAEKYFAYRNSQNGIIYGIERFIRLKEHPPFSQIGIIPTGMEDEMKQKGDDFRVDKNGFIEPSKKHDNPDLTIFFLGGSTTECAMVEARNRFPFLVGELLEEKLDKKINSYNSGVSGNNSLHSINILFNKVIPLSPSIVVMMHNINDLTTLLYGDSYWNHNPFRSPIIVKAPNLYRLLKEVKNTFIINTWEEFKKLKYKLFPNYGSQGEWPDAREKVIEVNRTKLISEFKMNLKTFINICKARNIIPVLMTQSNRLRDIPNDEIELKQAGGSFNLTEQSLENLRKEVPHDNIWGNLKALKDQKFKKQNEFLDAVEKKIGIDRTRNYKDLILKHGTKLRYGISYKEFKEIYDLFNETIRVVGKENSILVIDLANEIPQEKEYLYDSVHYNDNGSKLAASIISRELGKVIIEKGL